MFQTIEQLKEFMLFCKKNGFYEVTVDLLSFKVSPDNYDPEATKRAMDEFERKQREEFMGVALHGL